MRNGYILYKSGDRIKRIKYQIGCGKQKTLKKKKKNTRVMAYLINRLIILFTGKHDGE